ncbi:alpha/beta hydrolase [Nocardia sp. ET3-3]|uniref:Alpha/beta hydrolase n=2 Tax=Nocardia terrae TaxID=2675851 RepID=A0A7K1USP8_9NOCA|nr:alpha/beta hydrolase [Nocardia terrae]
MPEMAKRVMVTACAITRTTERATHRFGVTPFLPKLHADRFTHLGGMPEDQFRLQMAGCRSFEDTHWSTYWGSFASEYLARADEALAKLGGPSTQRLLDPTATTDLRALGDLLAPAVTLLADRGTVADPLAAQRFCAQHPESADAAVALDALIKALVYEFHAGWPGWSPGRLRAYERSYRLCEILVTALAPAMGVTVEAVEIPVGNSDRVRGLLMLPATAAAPVPTVLVTNGLEGTIAEALLPLLAQRDSGLGTFVMEMPGTYSYREPMSDASQAVYSKVIDFLAADARIDADRLGMMGFSFGAYWSARMAAVEPRLKVAVANGVLTDHSFGGSSSIGKPEILISTFRQTLGANSPLDLSRKLANLSLADRYRDIEIPILVVNGANDSLASPQDSIDLAAGAVRGQLALYADDDHCAMGHAVLWEELSTQFLRQHLLPAATAAVTV